METTLAGSFLAALLTFAVLSFLWRDNPIYRLAEHLFIGISLGLVVVFEVRHVLRARVMEPMFQHEQVAPKVSAALLLALAVLLLLRWAPAARVELHRLAQLPIALAVGGLAGIAAQSWVRGGLLPQLGATLTPLVPSPEMRHRAALCAAEEPGNAVLRFACGTGHFINEVLIALGVVLVLLHLTFTGKRRGPLIAAGWGGRVVLFLGLGAALGGLVSGRLITAAGRAHELLATPWLSLVALSMLILGLLGWERSRTPR